MRIGIDDVIAYYRVSHFAFVDDRTYILRIWETGDLQFQIGDYLFDLRYEFVLDLMRAASCFGVDDGYTGK